MDAIAEFFSLVTVAYLIRNYPGTMMLMGGTALALVMAWKHVQKATRWKWNPRQAFDVVLMGAMVFLLALGGARAVFWEW